MKEFVTLLLLTGLGHDQCEIRELSDWGVRQCLHWRFHEPARMAMRSDDLEVRRRAEVALDEHLEGVFRASSIGYWPPIEFVQRDCETLRRFQLFADMSEWSGWGWSVYNGEVRRNLTEAYVRRMVEGGATAQGMRATLLKAVAEESQKKKEGKVDEPIDEPEDDAPDNAAPAAP